MRVFVGSFSSELGLAVLVNGDREDNSLSSFTSKLILSEFV